jgi:hypothetical protein
MKTNRFTHLVTAVFGLAAFSTDMSAETENQATTILPPRMAVTIITVGMAGSSPTATVQMAAMAGGSDVASANWSDIKDCTYDLRDQFFAGLKRLEAKVDAQISELTAKRAAMKSTTNTQDWDFAMKEMRDARTALKSMGEELSKATPETWDQLKDKVGQAWVRTQDAYGKVKSSTTS